MNWPSGVRVSLLFHARVGRVTVVLPIWVGVEGVGGVWTGINCWELCCDLSRIRRLWVVLSVDTSARPSPPTATPCGLAGRAMVWVTALSRRSMMLTVDTPELVTYKV